METKITEQPFSLQLHPAYLWIGSLADLKDRAYSFVKKALCKHGGCGSCADCRNIDAGQHYAVLTLAPENYYTVSQLEPVMQALTFALDEGEHRFFIFEQAHLFNLATANSLLKSLEEPPPGYHFILLAPRTEGILPTIRSRCLVEYFASQAATDHHPLFDFFTRKSLAQSADFMTEVEKSKITHAELEELIDSLTHFWQQALEKAYALPSQTDANRALTILKILLDARSSFAMPGSSKIFLKNLFLRFTLAFDS